MEIEKKKKNSYTADDIDLLDGIEGVRKRPAMYIGSTNANGLHHLIWEIVDNAVDEAMSGYGKCITVYIHRDGSVSVQDEGRGIPVDIHKKTGISAAQLIFTTLHSGGKFNSHVYNTSSGLHGVGATATNALSLYCDVTISRSGKIYHLRFEDGGKLVTPLEVVGTTKKTGTLVRFKPDPKIFSTVDFKWETITNHLREKAFLLKGVRFIAVDARHSLREEFCYEKGIVEYVSILNENKKPIGNPIYFEGKENGIEVEAAFMYCYEDYNESIYSYANNVRTKDGGTHEIGFKTGITRAVNDFASENNLLKSKNKLEGSDIREGLTAIISLRIPEASLEYEGQTKGKLGTPEANTIVTNFIYNNFTYYLSENKEFAINLIKKCIASSEARLAARKAKEEIRSTKKQKVEMIISDKLTPAQSKNYAKNELFIVEGESAGGNARTGRNGLFQAVLPLRGKPLNTDSVTLDRMLKNEEFATLINTIGAGFGQNFSEEDMHYGKIIIMTDADTDGAHIQTLLLTFFYNFMRPLILSGKLYVAMPPLYYVSKEVNHKEIYEYAWNDEDLEKAKAKVGRGAYVARFKGLGEMNASQLWDTTMNPKTRRLLRVSIEDPFVVERRISILMGKDVNARRKWVEENVDFSLKDDFDKEAING